MKRVEFHQIGLYNFATDYVLIGKRNVLNIHKYSMKKHKKN